MKKPTKQTFTKPITSMVTPVMLRQVIKAADKEGRTVSSFLRVAVAEYLRQGGANGRFA